MDPQLVALISVITSGLVAITSAVVPFINERLRAAAQFRRDKEQALTLAANNVLQTLAHYRSRDVEVATQSNRESVYGELLTNYYKWKLEVSELSRDDEDERVVEVGRVIESANEQTLHERGPALAAEVHALTRLVGSRIR